MHKRIATVKATGERFLVAGLDFRGRKALLWGQMIACRYSRDQTWVLESRHAAGRSVSLDAIEIAPEQLITRDLAKALLAQYERSLVARRKLPEPSLGSLIQAREYGQRYH